MKSFSSTHLSPYTNEKNIEKDECSPFLSDLHPLTAYTRLCVADIRVMVDKNRK